MCQENREGSEDIVKYIDHDYTDSKRYLSVKVRIIVYTSVIHNKTEDLHFDFIMLLA